MELSVLVVDDEPFLAEETAAGLEFMGMPATVAGSAEEALAVLRARNDIGVLVTDLRMPRGNGLQLARDAQAIRGECNALAVILMTGYSSDIDAHGLACCIEKPFLIQDLAALVAQAMATVRARRAFHPTN